MYRLCVESHAPQNSDTRHFFELSSSFLQEDYLFKKLSYGIDSDSRIALVGPNGAGESMKLISSAGCKMVVTLDDATA